MRAEIRRKLAMAMRVLDFIMGHPGTDASYGPIVTRLQQLIARADALAEQERNGRVSESGALKRRRQLRASVQSQLQHLVYVARSAGRSDPAFDGKFTSPRAKSPNKTFIVSARAMVAAAVLLKDQLVAAGLGETLLDSLSAELNDLDSATAAAHGGKAAHVGARAELDAIGDGIVEAVTILDGLNRERFKDDQEMLAAWASARNVAGPFPPRPRTPVVPTPAPEPPTGA